MKALVEKISPSGDLSSEEFLKGVLEFRNTPRANGVSPAEMVFGHQTRPIIPAHRKEFVSNKWSHVGVVVGLGRYRDCRIKFASDSVLWRNRRFLRPIFNNDDGDVGSTSDANGGAGSLDGDIPDGGSSDVAVSSGDRTASLHGDTRKQSDGRETQTRIHLPQVHRRDRIRKKRVMFNC